jgi:hypothetical protein
MKWTQEQALAFEAARECMTALMAVYSADLVRTEASHGEDSEQAILIDAKISAFFNERASLTPTDVKGVERVFANYGPIVRKRLAQIRDSEGQRK